MAVTFAVPVDESTEQLPTSSPGVSGGIFEETDTVMDSFDIVDERTSLLRAEGGGISQTVLQGKSSGDISGAYQTPDVDSQPSVGDIHVAVNASNISLASSSSSDEDVEWVDAAEDRALTATSQSQSAPSTPHQKSSLTRQVSETAVASVPPPVVSSSAPTATTAGDMYHWMKRQQDFTASRLKSQRHGDSGVLQSRPPSLTQDSWMSAVASDMSHEDSFDAKRQRYVTHSAFQLADAQVYF